MNADNSTLHNQFIHFSTAEARSGDSTLSKQIQVIQHNFMEFNTAYENSGNPTHLRILYNT